MHLGLGCLSLCIYGIKEPHKTVSARSRHPNVRAWHMVVILYLKDGEQRVDNRIKVRCWSSFREVQLTSKELHSKQGENEDEEKQKEKE